MVRNQSCMAFLHKYVLILSLYLIYSSVNCGSQNKQVTAVINNKINLDSEHGMSAQQHCWRAHQDELDGHKSILNIRYSTARHRVQVVQNYNYHFRLGLEFIGNN